VEWWETQEFLCGMVESQGWSLGGWGGARDARTPTGIREERLEHRGPYFSYSFLIALTPHTDYCLSCKLFKRR